MSKDKYYCNCHTVERKGRLKKDGTRAIWKVREFKNMGLTTVDGDGICLNCGHYAVANFPDVDNSAENRVTDAKLNDRAYMAKRLEHIGDYFINQGECTWKMNTES